MIIASALACQARTDSVEVISAWGARVPASDRLVTIVTWT